MTNVLRLPAWVIGPLALVACQLPSADLPRGGLNVVTRPIETIQLSFEQPAGGWAGRVGPSLTASSLPIRALTAAELSMTGAPPDAPAIASDAEGRFRVAGNPRAQRGTLLVFDRDAAGDQLVAALGIDGAFSLGYSVAMSADGTTIVAGAPFAGPEWGGVYVFVRPDGGWAGTVPAARLITDGPDLDSLGWSVAVSADGETIVAGAPFNDTTGFEHGVALVYTRPPGGWAGVQTEAARVTPDTRQSGFGMSVAVSPDGRRIAALGPQIP
jgi:hypothetical protein